jgi:hypothetical protein
MSEDRLRNATKTANTANASATELSLRARECSSAGKESARVMTRTDLSAAAYRTARSRVAAAAASAIYSDKYFINIPPFSEWRIFLLKLINYFIFDETNSPFFATIMVSDKIRKNGVFKHEIKHNFIQAQHDICCIAYIRSITFVDIL